MLISFEGITYCPYGIISNSSFTFMKNIHRHITTVNGHKGLDRRTGVNGLKETMPVFIVSIVIISLDVSSRMYATSIKGVFGNVVVSYGLVGHAARLRVIGVTNVLPIGI